MSINMVEECPICFDPIGEKNNITTECGHNFHASCLMTNITRNGFSCPCCRVLMAHHDPSDDDDEEEDSDYDNNYSLFEEDEIYNEYALRGLRFFTNLLENQENDEYDINCEDLFNTAYENELERLDNEEPLPSLQFIINCLKNQNITYEQLVANSLTEFEEYETNETINRVANNLYGKIRNIISNYGSEERTIIN